MYVYGMYVLMYSILIKYIICMANWQPCLYCLWIVECHHGHGLRVGDVAYFRVYPNYFNYFSFSQLSVALQPDCEGGC